MNRPSILAALVFVLSPAAALGQRPSASPEDSLAIVHVPPIVVTATRTPTSPDEVASTITVIEKEEIERRQYRTALDAVRGVPGLSVAQSGGPGGIASVFIRGADADQVLVLVDGVEMNDPSAPAAAFDFANLLSHDIERIEVLRGPQSTLYGSHAMAGVIQIFTRAGAGAPRASVRVEGGTFGTRHATLSAGGGGEVRWAIDLARRETDGISAAAERLGNPEDDGNEVTSFSTRLGWAADSTAAVELVVRGSAAETDLDQNAPDGDDPNFVTADDELLARGEGRWSLAGGRWRGTLGFEIARHERDTDDAVDPTRPETRSTSAFEGRRWALDLQNVVDVLGGRFTAGIENEVSTASSTSFFDGPFGPFESELPETDARTIGVYGQHQATLGERLHLTAGARFDEHDRFGGRTTFRVAPALVFGEAGTRLRATYGTGFQAPSLFQLFDPRFGNRALDPERSAGWDVGLEQALAGGVVLASVTGFGTTFDDLVGFGEEGFRNLERAASEGVEATVSAFPTTRVRIGGSYTYTRTEDESGGPDDGESLLRRPRHAGDLMLEYGFPERGDLAVVARFVGDRDDLDFSTFPATRVSLDDHVTVRVAGSLAIVDRVRVFGRVENLFDTDVEEVLHFGSPGRAFYAGLDATF